MTTSNPTTAAPPGEIAQDWCWDQQSDAARAAVLVRRVAIGDASAFSALYGLFHRSVHGLVVSILKDREQAHEVTQDVFLQLWQQAARYETAQGSAAAWIFHVAHHRAVDRVRSCQTSAVRDTRYAASGFVPDTDTVLEDVLLRDQQTSVRAALQRLTPWQRQAIVLAYYGGMTTQQISDSIGVNRSTVKTRIRDGLRKLAADLRMEEQAADN